MDRNNRLARKDQRALEDWCELHRDGLENSRKTFAEIAKDASRLLGFEVTEFNIRGACAVMGIKKPSSRAPTTTDNSEIVKALAECLVAICKDAGWPYPAILEKKGVAP